MTARTADQQFAQYKADRDQPIRIYRNHDDKTGIIMCPAHRDAYFTRYPSAHGAGEWGGTCELCS